MNKISLLLTAFLMSLSLLAQSPMGINYQTVIRDGDGNILPDTELTLQMSIRSDAPDGEVVYQETHAVTTNAFGLVNLVIGNGTPQTGIFDGIDWGSGDKYLEIAVDLAGGDDFAILGVTQFLSVPYAIFSQKAAAVKDGANPGEILYWNGDAWVAIPPGEHDQTLRLCNGVPTWGACTYLLTLLADPADAGTVNGTGQYEAGEQVNITAEANPGWEFVNWTNANGVASEVANFTYTMPAVDVTLTANFVEEQVGFTCGDPLVDSRDGQSYSTVQIGNQCWMAENLNIGTRIDGNSNQANNGTIEKYCYNNSEAHCDVYGGLYQWNEMMGYNTTPGVQGICPDGWHLPTDAQWTALTTYLGGESVAGAKMKEAGTSHWSSPNTGANNSSGFTALPGGFRDAGEAFYYLSYYGLFWSSSEYDASNAWYRGLGYIYADVSRSYYYKSSGFSVRCLKE